ncbi:MAG: hypothetical protein AB1730_10550 [Myxococcota bacterium]
MTGSRAARWLAEAEALKRDGYTAAVVARKLIEVHGAPRAEAEAIASRLYGRTVNAYAGERFAAMAPWVASALLAATGALAFRVTVGPRFSPRVGFVYAALGLVTLIGAVRAAVASRRRTPPPSASSDA